MFIDVETGKTIGKLPLTHPGFHHYYNESFVLSFDGRYFAGIGSGDERTAKVQIRST